MQYPLTARENIWLGAPQATPDPAALTAAARKAGALELIEGLPRGWDTILSRRYTDGADLSGGQWQRVALARALFAVESGARLLILDEPTANLDVRAEAALYDRFLEITAGLTTIIISHRFFHGAAGADRNLRARWRPDHRARHPRRADGVGRAVRPDVHPASESV